MRPESTPPLFPPPALIDSKPRPSSGWRARLGAGVRTAIAPVLALAAFVVPPPGILGGHGGRLLNLPSLCLFYNFTGLPCPGCGISRSCVCFAHGKWADSCTFHPLGPLTFLVLCFFALRPLLLVIVPGLRRVRVSVNVVGLAAYSIMGLFIAVWIARLLHVLPPVPPA